MLTVWSVYWGTKYVPRYVYTLRSAVARNLSQPHRFVCMTDRPNEIPGIETVPPATDYPGWWQKVGLFTPGLIDGPALYLDLDVVIVGELDTLVREHACAELAMAKNWAQSGHGGWQSSAFITRGYPFPEIAQDFTPDVIDRLWGDQEWITERLGKRVQEIPPGPVCSYKYHCPNGLPETARVVVFHGKPDPHEVSDAWVKDHWR